jgi:tetratricopeptide (TPR) repeat protein
MKCKLILNKKLINMKKLIILLIIFQAVIISVKTYAQEMTVKNELAKGDTIKAELLKAQTLVRQGKKEEASKIFTSIMERHPDNKEAVQWWLIANMKRTPTGEEDAIQSLDSLSKIYPRNTGILFFRVFIKAEYGHNEEALTDVDKLIKMQPDSGINWLTKGQVLHAMNRYQEALEAFDKSLALGPERVDIYGMKASILIKLDKFDEALYTANKGIGLSPGNPAAIYNRACIYSLKGDKANALADLKKVLEMNPMFKQHARQDKDFKSLWEDEEFKTITK